MRRAFPSRRALPLLLLASVVWLGCSDQAPTTPGDPPPTALTTGGQFVDLTPAMEIQDRHTPSLMSLAGVVGTAVGLDSDGRAAVKVLVRDEGTSVPVELEGFPVEAVVTGEIFALGQQVDPLEKPTCGKRNLPPCAPPLDERHPRPVPIGVSAGHPAITAGTYGVRLTDGADVWALSNNHVFADINAASPGDAVIQPGTFDGGSSPADDFGNLADFEPISFAGCTNIMDAAIAATTTALAGNSTPEGVGYGTPRTATMAATVNMDVQKVGRTTGHTAGSVSAVNATVNVNYGVGIACFIDQIVVSGGLFSAGGDSGSLVVASGRGRSKSNDRRPVGLLFAGSTFTTILSPIDPILARFGLSVDGN